MHSTLDCEGSGSNRYTVKAAFREMVAESILQVELDVRKHSLTILPRQGLCLGRMFESRLTVITDLPENWLAHIQDNLADSVEPQPSCPGYHIQILIR